MRLLCKTLVLLAMGLLLLAAGSPSETAAARDRALWLMERHPFIDGHVDLPFIVRTLGKRPLDVIAEHSETRSMPGHIDLARMRQGRLGGLFMIAWTPCPEVKSTFDDFLSPNDAVRDTLEAIDIIQQLVAAAPDDLALTTSSEDVRHAFSKRKISTLIGVEGGHQLGNSLASLRLYAQLGVRYVTLTHTCHNSFASSAGSGAPISPIHLKNGLTEFGKEAVLEMNRLVLVDLSHTSPQTMKDAISLSRAPVLFSHSGADAVYSHPRNVPDAVLALIGDGPDQNPGIIMSVFYPPFIDPFNATVARVADHIDYIAKVCGKKHVGISSDFDGMNSAVEGLENAAQYPNLFAELILRGWTDDELVDVMGSNLLRVLDDAERVSRSLARQPASAATYAQRKDLPSQWGGINDEYLPADVRQYLSQKRCAHDEL